jgi:hypothetical protein
VWTLASTAVGVAVVLVMLRDVMHELLDPEDSGSLSWAVMHGTWRLVRAVGRHRPRLVHHGGALVLLSVAATWTGLLAVGFALVYWPRLPAGFDVTGNVPPEGTRGLATALYLSLSAMTTLNATAFAPLTTGLRFAVALESLVGMVLITAWITWVLSVYPVLAQRRAFAREVELLRRTHPRPAQAAADAPPEAVLGILRSLTEQVLRVASELGQARVMYYFQNPAPELALANQLPYVLDLARAVEERSDLAPAIGHHGALLRTAVETLLGDLGTQFLGLRDAPPERVLAALAEDHRLHTGRR